MRKRPRLINKPKPTPIPEPQVPQVPQVPLGDISKGNSLSTIINLAFVVIFTLTVLWLYGIYIDRKNTLMTDMRDVITTDGDIHPILQEQPAIVIPSNVADVPETFGFVA